jgi:hypothetical protein
VVERRRWREIAFCIPESTQWGAGARTFVEEVSGLTVARRGRGIGGWASFAMSGRNNWVLVRALLWEDSLGEVKGITWLWRLKGVACGDMQREGGWFK